MLCLTRKENEEIIITTPQGDKITLIIKRHTRDRAIIAIDAPSHFSIDRGEIYEKYSKRREELLSGKNIR
jgi:carbon storage regulator CsrA